MMRIAVKYGRKDAGKYVSHLDMQTMFARALRRAGIEVRYSQGFNPHIVTSFASAISVGFESCGEYMEFYVENDDMPLQVIRDALAKALPDCFYLIKVGELSQKTGKLMALVDECDYLIVPDSETEFWKDAFLRFLSLENCITSKERKGKIKEMDIRPLVYEGDVTEEGIYVRLALSGTESLNPQLLMKTIAEMNGRDTFQGHYIRKDLYTHSEKGREPLDKLFLAFR